MQNIRVMIVDDNEELRNQLGAYLRGQTDITVAGEAANGMEALKLLPECKPDVMIRLHGRPARRKADQRRIHRHACGQNALRGR